MTSHKTLGWKNFLLTNKGMHTANGNAKTSIKGSGINVDAYNALTMGDLKAAIDQIKSHHVIVNDLQKNPLKCITTNYAYDKRPQVRINGSGKGKKFYCSVIVKLYEERLKYADYLLVDHFDASHFWCHNEHCVETKHIHFEDQRVNKSRLCCRIFGYDARHHCLHVPECNICEATRIKL